ncbi:hypothetical protein [Thalassolituus maritimus]|uniref:Uncharacterized protein n=1 Tax=Thalassolituus maritimus TaxID=484498 RepID=A0ABQ0A179_9GAMM
MKKIEPRDIYMSFEGVRLYRDDIEHIESLMLREELDISISDGEYVYESLDELIEKRGGRPKKFTIEGREDSPFGTYKIIISGARAALVGEHHSFSYELGEFLRNRVILKYKIFNPSSWVLSFIISLTAITAALKHYSDPSQFPKWPIYLLFIIGTVCIISPVYRRFNFGLKLVSRHGSSFWYRNKDQIILLALGGVFGMLGTVAAQKIFN